MTSYAPPLTLNVASTQIPEAAVAVTVTLSNTSDLVKNQLLLNPGKPGAIAVYLENRSNCSLHWQLEVKGDFPVEWCHGCPDPLRLEAGQKLDRTIDFQVSADFFENPLALSSDRPKLQLNYQIEVLVYVQSQEEGENSGVPRQLVEHQVFTLCVRPPNPYLNFLPTLYREVDLVGRFLALIEQAFDPVVQTTDQLWAYLNPLTAPEALLPFLAHWVGWTGDVPWGTKQQRQLIQHAITLYRWHGTRHGLRLYLHLYTGLPLDDHLTDESAKHISIEEVFTNGFVLGNTVIGQDSMMGGGRPYHFSVKLRCDRPEQVAQLDEHLIRNLIERQKPAFCTYDLSISGGF